MPRLRLPQTELYYEDSRSGDQTIVFSHGLLCNTRLFDAQTKALREDYRCLAYDHRGQGKSAVPPGPMVDMETLYLDAVELIEQLRLGPVHWVGLSMGGFVGMRLAARRPDLVRSLTLISTAPDPEPAHNLPKYKLLNSIARLGGARFILDRILPIFFGPTFLDSPHDPALLEHWRDHFANLPPSIYKAVNGVLYRPGVQSELPRISAPTLVIWAADDVAIKRNRAELLTDYIPDTRMVVIPHAAHSCTVENPEPINHAIGDFLASLPEDTPQDP